MATIDAIIGASADDADEQSNGVVAITNANLLNTDQTGEWNGWIFRGITIPAGATITVAYLTGQHSTSTLDEPDLTVSGLASSTQAAWTTVGNPNSGISSRTRTTASITWAVADAGQSDIQSPSIVDIIQEIVNGNSGLSNAAIGIVATSRANDATRDTNWLAYDGSTTACMRLHIEYTEAATGNPHYAYRQQ